MNLLMFVPLVTFILISIGLGAITGLIAKKKHRSRALWWVAGSFGFPVAIVSILCFKDIELIPDEKKATSKLKERLILVVILVLWVGMTVARVRASIQ
jgi:hypothetical protein